MTSDIPSPDAPLPLRVVLERLHLADPQRSPPEALQGVTIEMQVLEDYRPLVDSLEWRLSDLYWAREGVRPFAANDVPFLINNDGRASESAAAVLYANCREAPPSHERIAVLELGAGAGLFARFFLDAFRDLCRQQGRDFYDRLVYFVTDLSPRTVEQWRERELFADHAGHVRLGTCDALRPANLHDTEGAGLAPLRAVILNYVLDVLPSAIVRAGASGPEQLCVRTHMTHHADLLGQYTRLTFDEVRALAASHLPADQVRLLPLVSLLEFEAAFRPLGEPMPPYLAEALDFGKGLKRIVLNHGAFACLEECGRLLEDDGFLLVQDYGPVERGQLDDHAVVQRFGGSTALGINFPLLEQHFTGAGLHVARPEGDDGQAIHARLLCRPGLAKTCAAFADRCSGSAYEYFQGPAEQARQHATAGRYQEALENYRLALERRSRDWHLLGEAAHFVALKVRDFATGLELARTAVALNPYYSAWLWNVVGDCLFYLRRTDEAHEAYLQARRIDPRDALTHYNLSYSHAERGELVEALQAIARGLGEDSQGTYRARLLDKQQQILAALSGRWQGEQDRLRQRSLAFA
jgi:tetratricopeptide (TPR) repeat protein